MSYATLLVHVDPNFTRESTIRIATQLADRFASRLLGVSAMPIRAPIITNGVVLDVVSQDEIDQMIERLQAKEDWFRQKTDASRQVVSWRSELDFPTEFVISQARCADLVIINPNRGLGGAYNSLDAAGVILKAGRPALLAPPELRSLAAQRIVVGWKDTREARRAVVDALPFLHEAAQVTIAAICEEADEKATQRGIDDVVQFLAHHRIKCDCKVLARSEGSSAARLLRLAGDERADLLVTGAYGHSRLGEWVFGGVTQELLASSPICCLMSH